MSHWGGTLTGSAFGLASLGTAMALLLLTAPAHGLSVDHEFAFTLAVDPPQPTVGDTVRLTFTVDLLSGRGGLPAYTLHTLEADPAVLAGDEPADPHHSGFPDTAIFERRAVSAGVTQIRLGVSYETGAEFEDGSCCVWFFTSVHSPVFELTVLDPDDPSLAPSDDCVGDCDEDGLVQVDELTQLVGIALGHSSAGSCAGSSSAVTVDVLVRAVRAALHGCSGSAATKTPTPTSTTTPLRPVASTPTPTESVTVSESGIDLYPLRVVLARCLTAECLTVPSDSASVCVGNRGSEDAGEFLVDVNGETQVLLDGLPSGVARCFAASVQGSATVLVDADGRIAESDEDNNEESFPGPGPTGCDVIVPPCTPTPTVTNVQSCEQCCDHCTTEACFLACFGVQGCQLVTEWEGTVTDATSDAPIPGAEVTVNGKTVTTDAEGFYATTSVEDEVCNGLDYLYEITVRAPGYADFVGRMYQSLVPGPRIQNVALLPNRE